jgi:hypothetical protein
MKKASWIVLTLVGVAITVISLVSAYHAYTADDDYGIGGVRLSKIADGNASIEQGLRGVRGTSAAYGAAFGVLFLAVVLGPYRRGESWAWNALLAAWLTNCVIVLIRVPAMGTNWGVQAAITQGIPIAIGLALGLGKSGRA